MVLMMMMMVDDGHYRQADQDRLGYDEKYS